MRGLCFALGGLITCFSLFLACVNKSCCCDSGIPDGRQILPFWCRHAFCSLALLAHPHSATGTSRKNWEEISHTLLLALPFIFFSFPHWPFSIFYFKSLFKSYLEVIPSGYLFLSALHVLVLVCWQQGLTLHVLMLRHVYCTTQIGKCFLDSFFFFSACIQLLSF